jgi:hypothetical protein
MDYTRIKHLIETNPKQSHINFGSEETAPPKEWIRRIETRLGVALPDSYKWFLQNYSGGEVNGDEIYSIYQIDDEEVSSGDIVHQYLVNKRAGYIENHEIPLMSTDFGEFFLLDASIAQENNEYPVYIKRGDDKQLFAENFIEFLTRVINQDFA